MPFLQLTRSPLLRRFIIGFVMASSLTLALICYANYFINHHKLVGDEELKVLNNVAVDDNKNTGADMPLTSLIDIPMNFNYTHANRNIKYTILWYNPAPWIIIGNKDIDKAMATCEYNNCHVTEDRRFLNDSAAVLFGITMQKMGRIPPVTHGQRNPDQVWVYYTREAPVYHVFAMDYILGQWNNVINWSMTNNLDSDVFNPYGTFNTRPRPYTNEPDYGNIYDMKTKMAVWLVSNCGSMSRRKDFIAALKKAGIEVDIFGRCGGKGRYTGNISDLVKPYKFYLSMENSFCKYYVTEKVIDRYNDDVIMLVRGGADYSRLIPNDTYVDAAMFPNVTTLTKYLLELSLDRPRYIEMLRNKYKYHSRTGGFAYPYTMCNLCKKLNNKHNIKRKSFANLKADVAKEGRCINPLDIVIK